MQLTALSLALSRIMGGGAWSPLSLFAAGEQGAWYDPSDLSTLYQDAAGTIPVTDVEQPVGLMLDKSGRGNHAFQGTTTPNDKRPILSARVNLLTNTEDFSAAAWLKTGAGTGAAPVVTLNAGTAPDGTNTASQIVFNTRAGTTTFDQSMIEFSAPSGATSGAAYKSGLWVKGNAGSQILIRQQGAIAYTKYTLTGGWDYLSQTEVSAITTVSFSFGLRQSVTGTINSSVTVLVWHPDLRPSNIGNNIPAYQRVNTATDYDTAGFPLYLKADGSFTSMSTNSIDFSATDKMTVVSGVRKLSDAIAGNLFELGGTFAASGGITYAVPWNTGVGNYGSASTGTVTASTSTGASYVSPISNVLTGQSAISTPLVNMRVNGTQAATSSASQGTGNYGNYPLYLFARNNASSFFNGYFYGAIIRGATTSGTDLTNAESYENQKAGGLY